MPGLVEGGVYNPRSNRGCTDILCLLLLFGVIGGLAAILILSIQREPDVINMLRYAQDDYGQFCGRPGSATADLPCVLYPTLDEDLKSQAAEAATMPFWKYYSIKLTSICVESCPDGIALSEPVPVYGGEDYPTGDATRDDSGWLAEGTTPEFYFSLRTVNLGGRCLPYSNSFEAPEQILCVSPSCTAAKSMGIGVTECAAVPTRDGADETWEVLTDAQKEACEAKVRVDTAQTFRSADGDDETDALTRKLASYVALTLAFAESVFDSLSTVLVLGVAMPVLLGFVYAMLLYFLAGLVIWLLVTLLILGMCFLDFLLCAHAGWIVLPSWLVGPANSTAVLSGSGAEVALLGGDSSASNEDLYGFLAVVALAVTLMLLLWICFSYKAIVRTIAITEEATKVFSTLPALMVWPFVELTFLIGALVYGIFALAVICHPSVWGGDSLTALFAVCQVAGTLWMIQFIHACDYTTMSAAVAYWFVTTNAQNDGCCGAEKCCKGWVAFCGVPKLLDAAWTVSSRHLGSLAFGAATITICQLIRLALHSIHSATKQAAQPLPCHTKLSTLPSEPDSFGGTRVGWSGRQLPRQDGLPLRHVCALVPREVHRVRVVLRLRQHCDRRHLLLRRVQGYLWTHHQVPGADRREQSRQEAAVRCLARPVHPLHRCGCNVPLSRRARRFHREAHAALPCWDRLCPRFLRRRRHLQRLRGDSRHGLPLRLPGHGSQLTTNLPLRLDARGTWRGRC